MRVISIRSIQKDNPTAQPCLKTERKLSNFVASYKEIPLFSANFFLYPTKKKRPRKKEEKRKKSISSFIMIPSPSMTYSSIWHNYLPNTYLLMLSTFWSVCQQMKLVHHKYIQSITNNMRKLDENVFTANRNKTCLKWAFSLCVFTCHIHTWTGPT